MEHFTIARSARIATTKLRVAERGPGNLGRRAGVPERPASNSNSFYSAKLVSSRAAVIGKCPSTVVMGANPPRADESATDLRGVFGKREPTAVSGVERHNLHAWERGANCATVLCSRGSRQDDQVGMVLAVYEDRTVEFQYATEHRVSFLAGHAHQLRQPHATASSVTPIISVRRRNWKRRRGEGWSGMRPF